MNRYNTYAGFGQESATVLPISIYSPEITSQLAAAFTKAEVFDIFLKWSGLYFESVALFTTDARQMTFLGGAGTNMRSGISPGQSVAVDCGCMIHRAIINNRVYSGPIPKGVNDREVMQSFLREVPDEMHIYPAEVGNAVDLLCYAESPKGMKEISLEGLGFIVENSVDTLRALYAAHQLQRLTK